MGSHAPAAEPSLPISTGLPNRTLPTVSPPVRGLLLGEKPTREEIGACRNFSVRLAPVGSEPSAADTEQLVAAVRRSFSIPERPDIEPLAEFARQFPSNPWVPAVLVNVGLARYSTGWFSTSMDAYDSAWRIAKSGTDPDSRRIADRAFAELMKMNARVGRQEVLEALFTEIKDRPLHHEAAGMVRESYSALATMKERPEISFRCGPLALGRILGHLQAPGNWLQQVGESKSPKGGFSLAQVHSLAGSYGLKMQMAKRQPGAAVVFPCIVHWKLDHYAALIRRTSDGLIHCQDPTFSNDTWLGDAALDQEASGFFLIPEGPLPEGWSSVGVEEAATVFGKGVTDKVSPGRANFFL